MNTTGYKDGTVNFQDLFYQNIGSTGSGDPEQLGAGVAVSSISTNFTGGDVQSTGVDSDVAISNNGFFLYRDLTDRTSTPAMVSSLSIPPAIWYPRTATWCSAIRQPTGVVNTSQSPGPLQVGAGQINPPQATGTIQLQTNLDAGSAVGDGYSSSIDVYDSLGDSHVVTVDFTKSAANTWNYTMTVPGADVGLNPSTWNSDAAYATGDTVTANGYLYKCTTAETSGTTTPTFPATSGGTVTDGTAVWTEVEAYPPVISSGTLSFNSSGALTSWTDAKNNTNSASTNVTGITISGLTDGAGALTFNWDQQQWFAAADSDGLGQQHVFHYPGWLQQWNLD